METLVIDLANCYGIKCLKKEIKLHKRHMAIYASNGSMKSSLARTFKDESEGVKSRDRIFELEGERNITIDGKKIDPESIMVIESQASTSGMAEASAGILVNEELKEEYAKTIKQREEFVKKLITEIAKSAGFKKDEATNQVLKDFGKDKIVELYEILREYRKHPRSGDLLSVKYAEVLGDKILEKIDKREIRGRLESYVERYKKMVRDSEYWSEVFDYNSADDIGRKLDKSGFFKARHAIKINAKDGKDSKEMSDYGVLENFVGNEREKTGKTMGSEWEQVDKAVSKPGGLIEFRKHVYENGRLLDLVLNKRPELRKKLWYEYFENAGQLVAEMLEFYDSSESEMRSMDERANAEKTRWDEVIRLYNSRFSVPFEINVTDRSRAILNGKIPTLQFKYKRKNEKSKTITMDDLANYMSTGEKRAFYILNVLFKIEARIREKSDTVIVLDDIVDSFDYANKYAIIQYLKEVSEHEFVRLIILTHNFDFFRTVVHREIVTQANCYYADKSPSRINLRGAGDVRSPLGDIKKRNKKIEDASLVAAIPLARNLVEYKCGEKACEYKRLTSLLHWKKETQDIRIKEMQCVLDKVLRPTGERSDGSDRAYDFIMRTASKCAKPSNDSLHSKIALAVAIRLEAERFMYGALDKKPPSESVRANTQELIKRYKEKNPQASCLDTLERVGLAVPDFIHLNAFMYEPLVDINHEDLRELFLAVRKLGRIKG